MTVRDLIAAFRKKSYRSQKFLIVSSCFTILKSSLIFSKFGDMLNLFVIEEKGFFEIFICLFFILITKDEYRNSILLAYHIYFKWLGPKLFTSMFYSSKKY